MDDITQIPGGREAKVKYYSGDYDVLQRGDFVRCAVTGKAIPLEDLRYWDFETQEAYADAQVMLKRHREVHGDRP